MADPELARRGGAEGGNPKVGMKIKLHENEKKSRSANADDCTFKDTW